MVTRIVVAAVLCWGLVGGPTALVWAAPEAAAQAQNGPVTHIVQPGETLFRIGLRYGVDWRQIAQANGLYGTLIYAGQELIIPGAQASPEAPPVTETPAPAPAPTDAPLPQPTPATETGDTTHIVQRGESLTLIASRYGTTATAIAVANRLVNPSLIYAGQALVIPGSASSAAPAPAAPAPGPSVGKRIVIDISDQRLYAYEGETVIYAFIASTGSPGLDTRPGVYSVLNKIPNAYGGTWNIWMPNWLGIYWAGRLQNGIHALPILPGGGRLWDGYLGTPVSYGCIILGITESQQLYDWAEVGIPVIINP
jgi:LysM repeat protein